MMGGGPGRFGGMLNQETLKPRNLSETLARLGGYFSRFWYMILVAVVFVVISTWSQVTTPELTGQATDCFLVPAGQSAFAQFASFGTNSGSPSTGTAQSPHRNYGHIICDWLHSDRCNFLHHGMDRSARLTRHTRGSFRETAFALA